jgi:hypothetical protein
VSDILSVFDTKDECSDVAAAPDKVILRADTVEAEGVEGAMVGAAVGVKAGESNTLLPLHAVLLYM